MSDIGVVIAIVTYKSADLTIDCLRSIEAERSTPGVHIRAIVVDNASGDAPPIAQAIQANRWSPWITLVEAPRNGGFAYGNNLALRRAYEDGPPAYFHLLNPDTRVRKGATAALVRFLEDHPEVGIVGSKLEDINGDDLPFAFRFPSILSELERGLGLGLVARLLRSWVTTVEVGPEPALIDWVVGASMMIRRKVVDSIGGLDENYFLYFEETDFCHRAKKAGFSTWYLPASRIVHITGQSSQVTGHQQAPKRLPTYWFESRRRYFAATYGLSYAIATDLTALLAYRVGALKLLLLGHMDHRTPHFVSDLMRHSPLWSKNRKAALAPIKTCVPPANT